jgi:hypothetical protein
MLPHPGKERSARRAALPGGRRLRRNFFKPRDRGNFRLTALRRTIRIADAILLHAVTQGAKKREPGI